MNGLRICMIAAAVAATAVVLPMTTLAQDTTTRTIEQFKCKDVMRESGPSRDTAVAFLHGFLLGKSGSSEFDIDVLASRTDAFFDLCLDTPDDSAVETMSKLSP